MYQGNPILESSVSVQMLLTTKRALNNAKAKVNYHTKMGNMFANKMREVVDKDGALMDKVMFSSLRKSHNHHIKKAQQFESIVEKLTEDLTDIRLSMGLIK